MKKDELETPSSASTPRQARSSPACFESDVTLLCTGVMSDSEQDLDTREREKPK